MGEVTGQYISYGCCMLLLDKLENASPMERWNTCANEEEYKLLCYLSCT